VSISSRSQARAEQWPHHLSGRGAGDAPRARRDLQGHRALDRRGPRDLRLAARAAAGREHGIDLTGIAGTGPRGRISKKDVLALVPAPVPQPLPPSSARRTQLSPTLR